MFNAILIEQEDYRVHVAQLEDSALPDNDVAIAVSYSTLNYKDALAITGKAPIAKTLPLVPGVDFSGTVVASRDPRFKKGQQVLASGHGLGEQHWGGLAQKVSVPGEWLVPLPKPLSPQDAMGLGTAGFTAMLCVRALLRRGLTPDKGPVIVTGATGGVGSVAVYLLARRGFSVVASTNRVQEVDYLRRLGAEEILDRATLSGPGKPLAKQRWAGAVDVAGGYTLANVCAGLQYGGVVAACGLAESMDFPVTVAPFILRGVQLIGVDSVHCAREERLAAWQALAEDWDAEVFAEVTQTVSLENAIDKAAELLAGQVRGRIVVDVNA